LVSWCLLQLFTTVLVEKLLTLGIVRHGSRTYRTTSYLDDNGVNGGLDACE
jgi:hypothetical protein